MKVESTHVDGGHSADDAEHRETDPANLPSSAHSGSLGVVRRTFGFSRGGT
jgi:hypothetical protein